MKKWTHVTVDIGRNTEIGYFRRFFSAAGSEVKFPNGSDSGPGSEKKNGTAPVRSDLTPNPSRRQNSLGSHSVSQFGKVSWLRFGVKHPDDSSYVFDSAS